MARKDDTEAVPDAASSVIKLERLARLLRQTGHAQGLNPVQWEALRYLARCNALSHSPGAMARYLGSTKGTVSQTLKSLSAKGLVRKQVVEKDNRGVSLYLTEAGLAVLAEDAGHVLQSDISELSDKTRRRFDRALSILLEQQRLRQGEPSFGTCEDCRFYREASTGMAAHCMKVNATVTAEETTLICVEHVKR
jgi:DNA-binding MarR family transcriptional regulator